VRHATRGRRVLRTWGEDYVAHGRDWTRAGFQALAIHRLGVERSKIQHRLVRAPLTLVYRALYVGARNVYGIEIPESAQIGRRVVFEHQHGIVVHGRAVIGDDCIIRHGVTLGIRSMDRLDEAPVLGKGVNVGCGAKILGGITVGDGAAIGANAVVLANVPAGALVAGIPAKIVRPSTAPPAMASPRSELDGKPDGADAKTNGHDGRSAARSTGRGSVSSIGDRRR
jgi:serine O-acetyltransferase